jgi:hypothetical protein
LIFALGAISYPIGFSADQPCFFRPYSPRWLIRAAYRLPGGYSNLEPLLPIPNRTVKRVCADDSVHSHAKVGHRQTIHQPDPLEGIGLF